METLGIIHTCTALRYTPGRRGRMLASDVRSPRFDPWPGQKVFSIFQLLHLTFHPMARSTSMSKIDSQNVILRFGDKSKMEGEYVVMLGIIHTCIALRYNRLF